LTRLVKRMPGRSITPLRERAWIASFFFLTFFVVTVSAWYLSALDADPNEAGSLHGNPSVIAEKQREAAATADKDQGGGGQHERRGFGNAGRFDHLSRPIIPKTGDLAVRSSKHSSSPFNHAVGISTTSRQE
jgi:hypothetical protein